MKPNNLLKLLGVIAACAFATLSLAAAPFGSAFTYQGRLSFGGGPAADGLYDLHFTLHDAASAGSPIGSAVALVAVPVSNGVFTAQLDFGATPFTSGEARWLELAVNTNGVLPLATLNPRQRLAPTPQAIYAGNAATASAVAPGAIDGGGIADGSISATDLSPGLLNGTFWKLTGNTGAGNFLGSVDNQPVEIRANNQAALRLVPYAASPSVVGGHSANTVNVGIVGAFIGGGGQADSRNLVSGRYGVLVGGHGNQVHGIGAFVGGGTSNSVEQVGSFVGGGSRNAAVRPYATVAGGSYNLAAETNGTIGGGSGNSLGGTFGYSTISGGLNNHVGLAQAGTIGGGIQHRISGNSHVATVGGGYQNFIETNGAAGTIAGGQFNLLTEGYASIGGGSFNTAHGRYASIGGGHRNFATGDWSFIGGGERNTNTGAHSVIGGGLGHAADGENSTVGGGFNNRANGGSSTIGGGNGHTANADYTTIAGGSDNVAATYGGTIGGGVLNNVNGTEAGYSTIAGGLWNTVANSQGGTISGGRLNIIADRSSNSFVGGGSYNLVDIFSPSSTIAGGSSNRVRGASFANVSGGYSNVVTGDFATVPGGSLNAASGNHAQAAGRRAKAIHNGSFVWADDTDADFTSTTTRQFAVRANNGVMIQSSATALDLRGGGAVRVAGAGLGATTPAFIHQATAANINANTTVIDHPHCNGNPNAILIITPNWNPGGAGGTYNNNVTGVFYNNSLGRWAIFNQNTGAAMPVNAAFNVLVIKP